MDRKDLKTKILQSFPRFRALWGYPAACALIALIAVAAWEFWSQSLRSTIVIEAGPKGGFFSDAANLLQNELQRYDIGSVIINRNDTLKIIEDVNDEKSSVDVGFMAQDPGNRKYPGVTAVGTIALEPWFIFYSASRDIKNLQDFKGLRLILEPPAAGGRAMAERILGEYGVNSQNTTFLPTTFGEISAAMRMGLGDAAFFLLPPGNKIVHELALNPQLRILSLPQADALASNLGFIRHVTIHEGGFDYVRNVPSQNIQLVAIPVTLIVKRDLKPAIVTIIAQFIKTHFQTATLVSGPGELLSIHEPSVAVNTHADSVLNNGLPYFYRTLPFSLAALLDHFSVYIGFIIVAASLYSSMRFPSPKIIWREIKLKWYVHKLEQLSNRVALAGKSIDSDDQRLIEKVRMLLNKEEARLHKVSKMLADLQAKMS
jgi:hypothetical protein